MTCCCSLFDFDGRGLGTLQVGEDLFGLGDILELLELGGLEEAQDGEGDGDGVVGCCKSVSL